MSTTMGSWGFDVNRPANGQILSSSLSNNHHTLNKNGDEDNRRHMEISSAMSHLKIPRPTLSRQINGNEFAAVDRLVQGPQRNSYYSDDSLPASKQRVKSNEDLTMPPRHQQLKTELMAWQNRMLQKDNKGKNPPSPKANSQRSAARLPTSTRPGSGVSNLTDNQHFDHDHLEPMVKAARVIKRYVELLYHLQSFYQRITDQLVSETMILRNNYDTVFNSSIFIQHCRRIVEQIQNAKPMWESKLANLQNLLRDISMFGKTNPGNETTFLQRRTTLINLLETLSRQKDLDTTYRSILMDIDRVLYDEKLAIQLQDELSTLLQHQSMLNDFTSLLQWNSSIYSANDRTRMNAVLPFLREQMITTDHYMTHVSQQLTELVTKLRSSEKYILSYTTTMPLLDDGMVPSIPEKVTEQRTHRKNDQTLKPSGILKPSAYRSSSIDRISDLDLNTIGAEIFQPNEIDQWNPFNRSQSQEKFDDEDEMHSPSTRRKLSKHRTSKSPDELMRKTMYSNT